MPSVGGISVSRVSGSPKPLAMRSIVYQTPGYNGYGIHRIGKGDNESEMSVVVYGTTSALKQVYESIVNLQGSKVSVTTDEGLIFNNLYLLKVGELTKQTAYPLGQRGEFKLVVLRG